MVVSYIITTYNRPELLPRAVGFVARERCVESELIVVDDNSRIPVEMPAVAQSAFPNAHRLIRNTTNLGVIGARNAGVHAASGQYVLFLDDDDESLPNRTADLLQIMDGSDFDFVAARCYMQSSISEKIVPLGNEGLLTPEKLLLYPSHIDGIMWRRKMLMETGGLDNRVPYLGEHISMVLRLLRGGSAWLSGAIVARFAYLEAGLTQQTQVDQRMKNQLAAMYQVLLEACTTPAFQQFGNGVLDMIQQEDIQDFDTYLVLLQQKMQLSKG